MELYYIQATKKPKIDEGGELSTHQYSKNCETNYANGTAHECPTPGLLSLRLLTPHPVPVLYIPALMSCTCEMECYERLCCLSLSAPSLF